MPDLTTLIAIAGIVATGALSQVGVKVTDSVLSKSKELLSLIRSNSPRLADIIEKAQHKPLDYAQVPLEVDAISQNNPQMKRLLMEMKEVVINDKKVAQAVVKELNEANPPITTLIENWDGLNIKGGTNTISGNLFLF